MTVQVDDLPPTFGRLLRSHRTRVGLTQRELADLSTISVRAIRDLEQGKARRPRHDTVRLIADGLRLSRQARAGLELAADSGRSAAALLPDYDADLAAPPVELDALIGREAETDALTAELADGRRRLIDLVGLSGVGKTRVASAVAGRLHERSHLPVLWVTVPAAVSPSVRDETLAALVRDCAQDLCTPVGADRTSAMTDLAELVGDRPTLLVLDGVHASRPHPERIGRLQRECSGLRILITSTRPCDLPGERVFLVTPLATPAEDETGEDSPAVRLFLDHAETAGSRPSPAELPLVAEICRLLDGVPAALAAAASWLAVYDLDRLLLALRETPTSMLEHLSGTKPSADAHNGLSRCLRELPARDRTLVARLGSLGDFTLDDVAASTGHSLPQSGRVLRTLLDLGVVRARRAHDRSRFQVLNLVRTLLA
jgi:transcriptional regulator with XRE-family HTH domain